MKKKNNIRFFSQKQCKREDNNIFKILKEKPPRIP